MAIQREIEQVGIPTILITLRPEASRQMGPPRGLHPVCFPLGDCLGGPGQVAVQRQVLRAALARWEAREEAGIIWERTFPAYVPDPAIQHDGEIIEG